MRYRATTEFRADSKSIVPLAKLLAVQWSRKPNVIEVMELGRTMSDSGGDVMSDRVERPSPHRERVGFAVWCSDINLAGDLGARRAELVSIIR